MLSKIKIFFLIFLINNILILTSCTKKNTFDATINDNLSKEIVLSVKGMNCSKCQKKLQNELINHLPEATKVEVISVNGPNNVIIQAPRTDLIMKKITSIITGFKYNIE